MSKVFSLINVLLLVCVAMPLAYAQIQLTSTGASTMLSLMSNLVFSFRSVNPDASVSFSVTTDETARLATIGGAPLVVDFGLSNAPYTATEVALAASKNLGTLISVPFTSSGQVISFNLGSTGIASLTLDRPTLLAIFDRSITMWNDTRIQALNPSIASSLPKYKINIIYRTDASGSSNSFVQALNSFKGSTFLPASDTPAWTYANTMNQCPPTTAVGETSWVLPPTPTVQGYACPSSGDLISSPLVIFNPYSIAYMPLSMLYAGQPMASMKNKAGTKVSLTDTSVQAAITAASISQAASVSSWLPVGDMSGVIDSSASDAWPMVEMGFYTIPLIVSPDCQRALQIAQYLIWSIQSLTATSAMTFLGYTPLPVAVQGTVIDALTQLRCGTAANSQAVFDSLLPDEQALQIISFIAAAFLIIEAGFFVWKRDHPAVRRHSFPVLLFVCLGAAGNVLTVTLYIGHPTQSTCDSIPWLRIFELVTVYAIFVIRVKKMLKIKDEDSHLDEHPDEHDEKPQTVELGAAPAITAGSDKILSYASSNGDSIGEAVEQPVSITIPSPAASAPDVVSPTTKSQIVAWVVEDTTGPAANSEEMRTKRVMQYLICLAVIILWLLIPVSQVIVEPPLMTQRVCQGDLQNAYHLIAILFNILLIVVTAVIAYLNKELDTVVHPIFIMLFVNALFQPMNFVVSSQQFPNRSAVALTLQPAVGILLGTLMEIGLITGEALAQALRYAPEEIINQINVQKQVSQFRRQSTAKLLLRKNTQRKLSVTPSADTPTPDVIVSAKDGAPPPAATDAWVANPLAK